MSDELDARFLEYVDNADETLIQSRSEEADRLLDELRGEQRNA